MSSTDKSVFKVLLTVAILQNKVDSVLAAVRHTLKAKISELQVCYTEHFKLANDRELI